jgi:thiamine pyrophosphate-dependent acetolactate synthase large subunit-like protein
LTDRYPDDLYRHLPRQRVDQSSSSVPSPGTFPIADDSAARSVQRALHPPWKAALVQCTSISPMMSCNTRLPAPEPQPAQRWYGAVSTDHPAIQSLASTINSATRPILIAGLGVNRNACETRLQTLVETLQAPVVCTVSAKGSLADDHPWCGGTFMGAEASHELIAQSDLIVTLGLDVVELFEPGRWPYHQRVLNIDSVPHQDGLFPNPGTGRDIGAALRRDALAHAV